jgi:hypothetical protein
MITLYDMVVSRADDVQSEYEAKEKNDAHAQYSRGTLLVFIWALMSRESVYVLHFYRFR